jgi:hypothetical protein
MIGIKAGIKVELQPWRFINRMSLEKTMSINFYRFMLGAYECVSLCDGSMDYQLEDMVTNATRSDVVRALKAHGLPTESITTPYAELYVEAGKHKILVDLGADNLVPTTGRMMESMQDAGLAPAGIDAVFITHAHPDHVGGALNKMGEPIFINANYFISKVEWEF